jgi:hypothetical protein
MKRAVLFILILFIVVNTQLFSQPDSTAYSKDFVFKEGIYLTFSDFKKNNPIVFEKIKTVSSEKGFNFWKTELMKASITYYDSAGSEKTIATRKLWGYSSGTSVYINYGADFYKVQVIGSLCHFTAFVQTTLGGTDAHTPYEMRDGYTQQQLMMDMSTGKVAQFTVVNMEGFLKRDEELHKEFTALSKKKKKQSIFIYLNKYNQKHPLYFPF